MGNENTPNTIDEYISVADKGAQEILIEIRKIIKESVPEAERDLRTILHIAIVRL